MVQDSLVTEGCKIYGNVHHSDVYKRQLRYGLVVAYFLQAFHGGVLHWLGVVHPIPKRLSLIHI